MYGQSINNCHVGKPQKGFKAMDDGSSTESETYENVKLEDVKSECVQEDVNALAARSLEQHNEHAKAEHAAPIPTSSYVDAAAASSMATERPTIVKLEVSSMNAVHSDPRPPAQEASRTSMCTDAPQPSADGEEPSACTQCKNQLLPVSEGVDALASNHKHTCSCCKLTFARKEGFSKSQLTKEANARCKACTGNMNNQARANTGASSSELICRACKNMLEADRFSKSQMAVHNDLARRCKDCIERKFFGTMREVKKRADKEKSLEDQIKKIKLAQRALARKKFDMDLRGSTRGEYEAGLKKEEAALNALAASLKSRNPAVYERVSMQIQVREPTGLGQESDKYLAKQKMKKIMKKKKQQPTRTSASSATNDSTTSAAPSEATPTEAVDDNDATTARKKAPTKRAAPKSAVKKAAPTKKPRAKKNSTQTETPAADKAAAASAETKPTPVLSKRAAAQAAKLSQWYTPPASAANETDSPPPRRILTRGRKRIAEPEIICISDDDSPQDKRTRAA